MSIHTTQQNSDTPTETAWTPNSGTNDAKSATTPQHNEQTVTDTPQATTPIKQWQAKIQNAKTLGTNSRRVLDIIATQETRNASAAYKQVYPKASDITARNNASQLLKKPSAQVYLQEHTTQAVNNILELANTARSELVRLNANQDILDRNFGKATIKQEQVTTGVTLVINLTGQDQQ